jgi:hypothetical protein
MPNLLTEIANKIENDNNVRIYFSGEITISLKDLKEINTDVELITRMLSSENQTNIEIEEVVLTESGD